MPYTVKMLSKNLRLLCGGDDFALKKYFNKYEIHITTHLRNYSQIEELHEMLDEMIPANISIISFNIVNVKTDGRSVVYTGCNISNKYKKIRTEVSNYGLE